MELSTVVAAKVSQDRELLKKLRQASPDTGINSVCLFFNVDKPQPDSLIDTARIRAASQAHKATIEAIPGLKVVNFLELAGLALVNGTADSIAKALELGCVSGAEKGDRPIFRGATR
jgi:hypothetical protein